MLQSKLTPIFFLVFALLTILVTQSTASPTLYDIPTTSTGQRDAVLAITIFVVIPFVYLNLNELDKMYLLSGRDKKEYTALHTELVRWSYIASIGYFIFVLI